MRGVVRLQGRRYAIATVCLLVAVLAVLGTGQLSVKLVTSDADLAWPEPDPAGASESELGPTGEAPGSDQQEAPGTDHQEAPGTDQQEAPGTDREEVAETQPPEVELVPYTGAVTNIFFHPLIAFPERAFDGDSYSRQMDDWFITVTEFVRIIESLYNDGYILVAPHHLYQWQTVDGQLVMVKKDLALPKGRRPLLLSIDDLNYYQYMKNNGTVHRFILDDKGKLATLTQFEGEEPLITDDNSIPTILEAFLEERPDFAFDGARGVIALTGFQGILGYQTHLLSSPGYEDERRGAVAVADTLKAMGWAFASHGYGHYSARTASLSLLLRDNAQWQQEVGELVGPTEYYIYPFGAYPTTDSANFRSLLDAGFHVFWGVGFGQRFDLASNHLYLDRIHIDGVAFRSHIDRPFMVDVKSVLDEARGWK